MPNNTPSFIAARPIPADVRIDPRPQRIALAGFIAGLGPLLVRNSPVK